jgi:FkbM family methyltransferase
MHVEECSLALLHYSLPVIDEQRNGLCIDIGVGTFAFYCELFARIGYDTVAIEPLPTPELVEVCKVLKINLIQSCVSDIDGNTILYIGTFQGSDNLNLSSIRPDWWGASSQSKQVSSITIDTLIKKINAQKITCMKLDVEGVELTILKQIQNIAEYLLPQVVVFEYGGGGTRENGAAGWSEDSIERTMECFRILKNLNFRTTILLDSSPGSTERLFDLAQINIDPEILFPPQSDYGNAICFRNRIIEKANIEKIASNYRDNNLPPPLPIPKFDLFERYKWRLEHVIHRRR